jgi:hypothetical protein
MRGKGVHFKTINSPQEGAVAFLGGKFSFNTKIDSKVSCDPVYIHVPAFEWMPLINVGKANRIVVPRPKRRRVGA